MEPKTRILLASTRQETRNKAGSTYFLNDGDEYIIQLDNGTPNVVLARIEIDGVYISPAGVVLYPGQVIDLERYIDSPQKFKFVTYTVPEKNGDAIRDNGKIKVEFYNQYLPSVYSPPMWSLRPMRSSSGRCLTIPGGSVSTPTTATPQYVDPNVWSVSYASDSDTFTVNYSVDRELHTGKTIPGGHSSQEFVDIEMQFNSWPFWTTELFLKPMSEYVKLGKKETAVYCPTCGRRFRKKERFCPQCGTKR